MPDVSPHQKSLFRLMVFGTALSFGVLAAIIASMKDFVGGNAAFHFSGRSVLAFFAGFLGGLLFWQITKLWARKRIKKEQSGPS